MPVDIRHLPLRSYMFVFKGVTAMLPFRWPEVIAGEGSLSQLAERIVADGHQRVLLVTDQSILQLGLAQSLIEGCAAAGISLQVFAEVTPDPSVALIEAGTAVAKAHQAEAVIGFGGGSVLDAAKLIGAGVLNTKPLLKMVGMFKVRKGMLPLYAVPTTSGTGSEATIAAVVSDHQAQRKLAVLDLKLMPKVAVLDPQLTLNLPAPITAATGMDALTHAIEAYLSRNALERTDELALKAARLINGALVKAYTCEEHMVARSQMAQAAMLAGQAFTQAGVGYVHAIAHNLGAYYKVPHGLANAMVMPYILRFNKPACTSRMAELAKVMGLNSTATPQSDDALADALIERVEQLNRKFDIPLTVSQLKAEDIPAIVRAARAEARYTYAVPRYMSQQQGEALLNEMLAVD